MEAGNAHILTFQRTSPIALAQATLKINGRETSSMTPQFISKNTIKNLHCVIKSSALNFPEVVSAKVSLNNYKGFANTREHIQNIKSIL